MMGKVKKKPVIFYLCDFKACSHCMGPDGRCHHTSDRHHSINYSHGSDIDPVYFRKMADGTLVESEMGYHKKHGIWIGGGSD